MRRLLLLTVAAALTLASCSGAAELRGDLVGPTPRPPATEDPPPAPTPETPTGNPPVDPDATPTPEPVTIVAGDRLWVLDEGGRLSTMRPDGSDVVALTPDDRSVSDSQPTWSPDADRLAWVRVDGPTGDSVVAVSRADRTGSWETPIDAPPFYLAWDPSSRRLAATSPGGAGFDLSVVDVAEQLAPVRIDAGQPYWMSWGPGGDELFVHADGFRLDRVDLRGGTIIVEASPGSFQAPVWSGAERGLLFADSLEAVAGSGPTAVLVSSGSEGQGRLPLVAYDGYLQFVHSAASNRIALQVLPEPPQPIPDVVTAGFDARPAQTELGATVRPLQLVVVASFGGEPLVISEDAVVAFFWSPDGTLLAWLSPVDPADPEPWMQWRFWDGRALWSSPEFLPSETFATDYLPYFDQYAQSLTLFSPDGSQLVYPGTDRDGRSGVWVLPLFPEATPERVAPGVMAAWSPATAGSAAANAP